MPLAQLITAEQLHAQMAQPGLILLDCRFSLEDPAYGQHSFSAGHIPGAQFIDLEKDLSAPVIRGKTGRHPLPEPGQLIQRLRQLGVNNDSTLVLYDDGPSSFAARCWWLLAWLGKRDGVLILDGGLNAWKAAGYELTTEEVQLPPGNLDGRPHNDMLLTAEDVAAMLNDADVTLLDARGLPRFRGEVEPIDPVGGHIPGAVCMPFSDNLDSNEHFLSPQQLRKRFEAVIGNHAPESVVAYCGSGVTACHNLFALSLAGFPLPRLYAGSWSEWITDPQRPVATGD